LRPALYASGGHSGPCVYD